MKMIGVLGLVLIQAAVVAQNVRYATVLDYEAPPATLQVLWNKTSVVVRGKIVKAGSPALLNPGGSVGRALDLQILEVLRDADGAIKGRKTIRVIQPGGTAKVDGGIVKTSAMTRSLEVRDVVVLFLESKGSGFFPRWGDSGAFWLSDTNPKFEVSVPYPLRKMNGFDGKPLIEQERLLATLRQLPPGEPRN